MNIEKTLDAQQTLAILTVELPLISIDSALPVTALCTTIHYC